MGKDKNDKKSNQEKRESFVAKQSKQKRKNTLIAAGVFAVVAIIVGYAAWHFVENATTTLEFGKLGNDHQHASILVRIHGDKFDFSGPAYQVKNAFIHFEGLDGETIHRHATNVPLGFLFETIKIELTDDCFIFPDRTPQHTFCTNDDYSLKFYINHKKVDSIVNYVIQEDDRILISYGGETPEEIEAQLKELDAQVIRR
ncbi:MAG: protein-disulfide isomerase [Candidatus Nitrosotenuis sp.]